ncbi:hypothetical protein SK3146_00911 [Paenibacillus konkukensis]|uniref:Uncharacterized protein n=1 Tax=Paenibacillus konkukensis TaxID=2020716 RepID=A0ABY4RIB0_9BACL|nr:hypothetical protein SK3146_00911 [Paenibacillus konkukensis]
MVMRTGIEHTIAMIMRIVIDWRELEKSDEVIPQIHYDDSD